MPERAYAMIKHTPEENDLIRDLSASLMAIVPVFSRNGSVTATPIGTSIAAHAVLDMNMDGTKATMTNPSKSRRGFVPT